MRLLLSTVKMGEVSGLCHAQSRAMQPTGTDTQLQGLIDLALRGESSAHEALLHHACDRLLRLTRKMFHGYPNLRRWEATDDVFQNAMLRLHRALAEVRVESVRHFFNLAAVQVRRRGLVNIAPFLAGGRGAALFEWRVRLDGDRMRPRTQLLSEASVEF